MSARVAWPSALVTLASILLTSAAAAGPWALAPREFFVDVHGGGWSADTYHDANGDRQLLFGGGDQQVRGIASYVEMGWKKNLSIAFGMPMANVSRVPEAGERPPSTTGFADGLLGLRYNLRNGESAMSVQVDWQPPLGYRRDLSLSPEDSLACGDSNGDGDSLDTNCARQTGRARLGEGVQVVSFWLHAGTALPFAAGFMQASGGYRYRFEDPVEQYVANADVAWWARETLLLAGRYRAEFAADNPDRPTDKVSRQRVGPLFLYRVMPTFDVYAGSLHTFAAANATHTDEYFVGISMRHTGLHRLQGYLGGAREP